MSVSAEWVLGGIRRALKETRRCGGNVNRVTTSPVLKRELIRYLGGAPDSALIIEKAHVIADETHPPGLISFTWWEA